MLRPIDEYFLRQEEPVRSCLGFLRNFIVRSDERISESFKYGMPFYSLNGKMCCYLWVDKKLRHPYIGIVEGNRINFPGLLSGKRARMKIFMVDPLKDIPVKEIKKLLDEMSRLYTK